MVLCHFSQLWIEHTQTTTGRQQIADQTSLISTCLIAQVARLRPISRLAFHQPQAADRSATISGGSATRYVARSRVPDKAEIAEDCRGTGGNIPRRMKVGSDVLVPSDVRVYTEKVCGFRCKIDAYLTSRGEPLTWTCRTGTAAVAWCKRSRDAVRCLPACLPARSTHAGAWISCPHTGR